MGKSKGERKHFEVSSEKHQTKHCLFAFNKNCRCFCLQLWVFLPAFAVFFACVWRVFLPAILVFLPTNCLYFACKSKQSCTLVAGQFACVPQLKLPPKYPIYSGKFTRDCRQSRVFCAGFYK